MNAVYTVEPKHIERLTPEQLVRLLHHLLHAEARQLGLRGHGIHVPFQINHPDGGTDGTWDEGVRVEGYIPRPLTRYQCKAKAMTAKDCSKEVLKKGQKGQAQLKESVEEVLQNGGAYVFFSSKPCTRIGPRISSTRDAIAAANPAFPDACIGFLDANKIADWTNQHLGALTFVLYAVTNWEARGFRTVEEWGREQIFNFDFQSSDFLDKCITDLRTWLAVRQNVARVTGSSGLGKTRLAYEVFHASAIGGDSPREGLAAATVYTDAKISGQDVLSTVDQLSTLGKTGILVVDNCPQDWHYKLATMVKRERSNLTLFTLDYVPESHPTDALHVQLIPEKLKDVVPKILRAAPDICHLGESAIAQIADFAQGFPQIAILTARAGGALNLKMLNNQGKLAERLLWGRDEPDPESREIIRCLALFSSVGVSGRSESQIRFVRERLCNGVSEYHFNRLTRRFKDMRVIQSAGDFIMVTPSPLAIALAAEWLEDIPDGELLPLLAGIDSVGLTRPFCDQIRQLDFSEKATDLSAKLMGPSGPLSSAEVLNSTVGSQIFRALSEVNPPAAVQCLYGLFANAAPERSRSVSRGRRDLVWALEKLCWPANLFPKAATVSLVFAAGENEQWSNNATGHFQQLFHLYLSGTRCPAMDRLVVLRDGLRSAYHEVRAVCIKALGEGLESQNFSRSSGPEVRGTRPPETDWEPAYYSEIWNYWRECFRLLRDQILKDDDLAQTALETLGSKLGSVLSCPLARELEIDFKEIAQCRKNHWPSAKASIRLALERHSDDESHRAAIERWAAIVQPANLENRLADVVSTPGWRHGKNERGESIDVAEVHARELADELHRTGEDWLQFLPNLLVGEQRQAGAFGARLAELSDDPSRLVDRCLDGLREVSGENKANPQLLRGILFALADRALVASALDRAASDDALRRFLVPLSTTAARSILDFDRVAKEVEAGRLPPDSVREFAYGSVSRHFADEDLCVRLEELIARAPETKPAVLELLYMHCLGVGNKPGVLEPLVLELAVSPEVLATAIDDQFGYEWEKITCDIIRTNPPTQWLEGLIRAIVSEQLRSPSMAYRRDHVASVLATLLAKHSGVVWPVIEGAIAQASGSRRRDLVHLLCRRGSRFQDTGSPIWNLPLDQFREWTAKNPGVVSLVLGLISLYGIEKDEGGEERLRWHPHALALLELVDDEAIAGSLHSNIFSFSSWGSQVPYFEKRIRLVNELLATNNPRLKPIVESLLRDLVTARDQEHRRDAERAAGIL